MRNPRARPHHTHCGPEPPARTFLHHRDRKYPGHGHGYRRMELFGPARGRRLRPSDADLDPLRRGGSHPDARGQPLCTGEPACERRADRPFASQDHGLVYGVVRPVFGHLPVHGEQSDHRPDDQRISRRRRVPAAARLRDDRLCREPRDADLLRRTGPGQ